MIATLTQTLTGRVARGESAWFFLDYDGTLADFAPTPDDVIPDPQVIQLLSALEEIELSRVAVISGRRLSHIQKLVPVPGIWLAGTYGVELQFPDGQQVDRVPYESIRPVLEKIKPRWAELIAKQRGFYLEDKGWALAIHARFAEEKDADRVLTNAHHIISEFGPLKDFRVLGGHKFLEIGPKMANKGRTVAYMLERFSGSGLIPIYVGDDDKDEEAFRVIKQLGGVAIVVAKQARETVADYRLESPQAVHAWLGELISHFEA